MPLLIRSSLDLFLGLCRMPLLIRSFLDLNSRTLSNVFANSLILGSWRPSRGRVESIADSCPWLFNSCFEPQHPGVPSSAAREEPPQGLPPLGRPSRGRAGSVADSCPWLSDSCFEPQLPGVPSSATREEPPQGLPNEKLKVKCGVGRTSPGPPAPWAAFPGQGGARI